MLSIRALALAPRAPAAMACGCVLAGLLSCRPTQPVGEAPKLAPLAAHSVVVPDAVMIPPIPPECEGIVNVVVPFANCHGLDASFFGSADGTLQIVATAEPAGMSFKCSLTCVKTSGVAMWHFILDRAEEHRPNHLRCTAQPGVSLSLVFVSGVAVPDGVDFVSVRDLDGPFRAEASFGADADGALVIGGLHVVDDDRCP